MDFLGCYKNLIIEVFLFRNYKRMDIILAILCAICVSPFIIIFVSLLLLYGGIIILLEFFEGPLKYLHSFLKQEGQDVSPAAQFIIYFIGFPLIFTLKTVVSLFTFILFIVHLLSIVMGYYATLGGLEMNLFITNNVDLNKKYDLVDYKRGLIITFILIVICTFTISNICNMVSESVSMTKAEAFTIFKSNINYIPSNLLTSEEKREILSDIKDGTITKNNYVSYINFKYDVNVYSWMKNKGLLTSINGENEILNDIKNILDGINGLFILIYIPIVFGIRKVKEKDDEEKELTNTPKLAI